MTNWYFFAINQWSWSLTWGWYQLALGLICSVTIFMVMRKLKSLPALILLITSYWSAFIVYFACVGLLSLYMIYVEQVAIDIVPGITVASIVALFFTGIQGIFLKIVHSIYRVKLTCALWVTFVANGIAAVTTYLLTLYMDKGSFELVANIKNFF